MDDVIKKLETIEGLLEKLINQKNFYQPQATCLHPRMMPSHMVIMRPTKFTCPDCGKEETIYPNTTW